ncbi:MAG: Pls/PosA family non-ribosomal peptide synthetase, partial [Pseudonocardia sediminis]
DHRGVGPAPCGTRRRLVYGLTQLVTALLLYLPLVVGGVDILLARFPQLTGALTTGALDTASPVFYLDALGVSFALFAGAIVAGLVLVVTVPRVLALAVRPERTYPLYGFHYSMHRTVARLTNLKFYTYLFGDSSYIVGYLRAIGYDLSRTVQTGSNFGTGVKHETPFLATIGSGTMVADGLSVVNADFSTTSFRVSRATIGARNFLGNRIAYPSRGRTGDNCLLATKVMVPLDGPVRENVGLLGSPSFEIPRTVERDGRFDHLESGIENAVRLSRKNRYNLRSIGLALLVRWMHVFGITLLAMTAAEFYERFGAATLAVEIAGVLLFTFLYYIVVERAVAGFRPLRPRFCSIYDPYFWWHERFWKLVIPELDRMLAGTPFKNVVSRMLGVRIGARVFDDGCFLPERTLVAIGDDATLNVGTVIQSHSQEDGAFKSDHSRLGSRVTLGVGAFVHYGVTVGDDAVLGPDSFLMKGEQVPPGARWDGNPAGARALTHDLGRHG